MAEPKLDILLFGATGITGLHCIPYLYKFSKRDGRNLTWGISGRSEEKLKEVLNKTGKKIGADLSQIPIVLADVIDSDSLFKMAQKAKVVINCCGPYSKLGKPVLNACVAAGTHHLDVSGEPEYIDSLPKIYQKKAEEKGLYIVSTCGMDCVPCDLGITYLQEKFDGVLNSVVAYLKIWSKYVDSGPLIGYGTWSSFIPALKYSMQFSELQKKFFPQNKYDLKPELKVKYWPHHSEAMNGWSMLFPAHDKIVAETTQKYRYEVESKRPVQIETLFTMNKFSNVLKMSIGFMILLILSIFDFSRQWLINYPHIFSFGYVRKDQYPSDKVLENTIFQLTLQGEGWKEKLANKHDQYSTPPDKTVTALIKITNPGYDFTGAALVGAALMIITEKDKLPPKGGVYSPGAALGKTSFMKLLLDNVMSFDILYEKNL